MELKVNKKVLYISGEWTIVSINDRGIELKSANKNIDNTYVPHKYSTKIYPLKYEKVHKQEFYED